MTACLRLFVVLATLGLPLWAGAQESSVEILPPPGAVSSGEVPPPEAPAPAPPPCGTQPITIARMQWPSSAILA